MIVSDREYWCRKLCFRLSEHPLSQTYEWTKKEKSEEGRPLAEVVELALTSPLIASDCLGGLFRELRIAANKVPGVRIW